MTKISNTDHIENKIVGYIKIVQKKHKKSIFRKIKQEYRKLGKPCCVGRATNTY